MTPDAPLFPPDREAALAWAVRTGDPDFADWEALTVWLEGDPARADLYGRAVVDLSDATALLRAAPPPLVEAVRKRVARPSRRWIAGAAVAAGVAGLVAIGLPGDPVARPYAVATGIGETRTVALADGSRIVLAGGTRLLLDRADPRVATVERGQALFTVRHDAAHPFRVTARGERLVDTGTVFDVAVDPDRLAVAVAEGGVRIGEGAPAIDLGPGEQAEIDRRGRRVSRVRAAAVGAWAGGQLDFAGAPVGEVAAAVGRALGVPVAVAPGLAVTPFTGTLSLDALRRDPAALGPLTGGVMVRDGRGWELRTPP